MLAGHVSTCQCPKNFVESARNVPKISSPATSSLCLFIIYLALSSPRRLSLPYLFLSTQSPFLSLISFSPLSLPFSSPWWPAGLGLTWQQGAARPAGEGRAQAARGRRPNAAARGRRPSARPSPSRAPPAAAPLPAGRPSAAAPLPGGGRTPTAAPLPGREPLRSGRASPRWREVPVKRPLIREDLNVI